MRIEIPREFLEPQGVPIAENDTSFVTSNIRNDYYYYNLVDESKHWTYAWRDQASDGPCFKPDFSYYDPNAPYCLEIWNYLSSPLDYNTGALAPNSAPIPYLLQPDYTIYCWVPGTPYDSARLCPSGYFNTHYFNYTYLVGVDYCQPPNLDNYVFQCFSASPAAPKFVLLHGLSSPGLAGVYDFTLSVANRTNILGYPDFVHAWHTTLHVPVSMAYNAGSIVGNVCDAGSGPPFCSGEIGAKGVVYAMQCPAGGTCSLTTATIVARAYVNQCYIGDCGPTFDLTGLAPGSYLVEGSAGVDADGVAYSLTPLGYQNPTPTQVLVSANSVTDIGQLPLRRAPLACVMISFYNPNLAPSPVLNTYLTTAGFAPPAPIPPFPPPFPPSSTPNYDAKIMVEATDPSGHMFRFRGGIPYTDHTQTTFGPFALETGIGVKYVGTDPYGTEYAGLPAPEDIGPGGYTMSVNVYVSGFVQRTTESVTITQSPGTLIPECGPTINQPLVSPSPVSLIMGGLIVGELQFCSTYQGQCILEAPPPAGPEFGGNILIEAFDQSGLLRGVTVIDGTANDGTTDYFSPTTTTPPTVCLAVDSSGGCAAIRFFVVGFSEFYYHSLSGIWHTYPPDYGHDYGLPDGQYSLSIYVRGYELTSTSTTISIVGGSNEAVVASMTRGGAFQVTAGSYDNRLGTTTIQQQLPWRFLNSSIPVSARVYFSGPTGTVGYVDLVMVLGSQDAGLASVGVFLFTVLFAGQNWSLREIWFYGQIPTYITNATYTIEAYTLGYVPQSGGGVSLSNSLLGFNQVLLVMFVANEADITAPLFSNPQSLTTTPEYDQPIGQAYLAGGLAGAETANLTSGTPTLEFNVFGFGGMSLTTIAVSVDSTYEFIPCETVEFDGLGPLVFVCGQGHFFYVDPTGTPYFDFGMGVGNYTMEVPEFGFNYHFLQVSAPPTASFTDLFQQVGVVFSMIQMGIITQGSTSLVQGFCSVNGGGICLNNQPSNVAPLSWVQVQAVNSTYSTSTSTADGTFNGVDALFVPAGTYNITFSDVQYQSETYVNYQVGWGSPYSLTPNPPLCPTGGTCP